MCKYQFILAGQCVELVFCCPEFLSGDFRNSLCNCNIKSLRGIQTSTNSSTTQCQCLQERQSCLKHFLIPFQCASPSADFLRKCDWSCILQVGTAALYDAFIFCFQTLECCNQLINCRKHLIFDCNHSRNVHCSRECVVGRLAHVDIIVWMQQLLASDFIPTVCNNFICVHV